ncbi:High mobility group box domain [Dillenia turbinata]|uniref:High mobility group box domain n=1 Tax=Dillenia turbinata TaxID=194707 RepID=A0AAN8UL49_9MAGN
MKGLKATTIAQKKPDIENLKKRKSDGNAKKEKANKKASGAPKRPPSAFFVFMEEFRKAYKENFPDNKSVAAVGKAGGAKWKSMSESGKAPYVSKAQKKKAEYEKAMEEFNSKPNVDNATTESGKSTSEVQDDQEQEASS